MGKGSGSEPVTYRKTSSASTTSDPCTQDLWTGSHTADPDVDGGVRVASLTVPSHWSPARIAPSDWSAPDDHDRTTVRTITVSTCRTCYYRRFRFLTSSQHLLVSSPPPPPHGNQHSIAPHHGRVRCCLTSTDSWELHRVVCVHTVTKRENNRIGGLLRPISVLSQPPDSHDVIQQNNQQQTVWRLQQQTVYLRSWKPFPFRQNQNAINIPTFERFRMFDYRPCCAYCPPTSPPF